jgi:hypothetical protein
MSRHPSSFHYPYLCNTAYRYLIQKLSTLLLSYETCLLQEMRISGALHEQKLWPTVTNNRFLIVYVTVLSACAV